MEILEITETDDQRRYPLIVVVGDALFNFTDFDNWCDTARVKFAQAGMTWKDVLCVDAFGRICLKGKEFMRARDEGAFPVTVYPALVA